MERATSSGRHVRWAEGDEPAGRAGSARRVGPRVAWDHSVLEEGRANLQWNPRARVEQRVEESVRPFWILVVAWGLVLWSVISVWGAWTRHDVDAHLSLRFLARGDVEELLGVVMGLLWFVTPAAAAFWMARHARIVSRDEVGGRSYWTALVVAVLAALGVFRPVWDAGAGSRFALMRSAPAGASASAPDASGDASNQTGDPTASVQDSGPSASVLPGTEFVYGPWPQDSTALGQTADAAASGDGG